MKSVPWRMILVLVLLVLVALFSGFNLIPVNISIGFHVFTGVPLFLALLASFIAGAIVMVPFAILQKRPKKVPLPGESDLTGKPKKIRKKSLKAGETTPQPPEETVSEE